MFQELLLEKKNLDKIEIYKKLLTLEPDTYNLLWLSHFFNLSYSKTMSAITEIDVDLQTIEPDFQSIITDNHKIVLREELPSEGSLTTYLIQQDIPFRFIIEMIENKYEHLDEFSNQNFASSSTVRRKLAPLAKFLAQYHIRLKLSTMDLSGDERIIRTVFSTLLWLSSRGSEIPINHFDTDEVNRVVKNTLYLTPKNDRVPSMAIIRKIDADIAYYRIRNNHFVEDDPNYGMVLPEGQMLDKFSFGELVGAPPEHQYAETRYMAFRQFFGPVFFEKDDPLFDLPRSDLEENSPKVNDFLQRFRKFVEEEILDYSKLPIEDQEKIHVLRGNVVMIFFNYLVFKSRVPFPFLLTESENLSRNRIYDSLFRKFERFLKKIARDPQVRWINYCIDDMCKIFTVLLLPEYEENEKEYNINVTLIQEEQYIYNHKMEKFLQSLAFVNYLPYEEAKSEDYDLIIASSKLSTKNNPRENVYIFPYSLDEKNYLELRIALKELHIDKITI